MIKNITINFPDDFVPPEEFDPATLKNSWESKCSKCPFYWFSDDQGDFCQFPDDSSGIKCPIRKYFE